jgi:hypothetical protein
LLLLLLLLLLLRGCRNACIDFLANFTTSQPATLDQCPQQQQCLAST